MIVSMTSKIQELAEEASDPEEAGRKMRQLYFTNCKLTNRQLTVDLLKKLLERGVGTHDVENLSLKLIKGEPRRNPEIVKTLIRIKLEDAQKWQHRIRKQSLKEKAELYRLINRRGLIKEEFWSALRRDVERRWRKGKEKNQKKADRLEGTYKGARPYTGMVENIRVGDRELGEEEEDDGGGGREGGEADEVDLGVDGEDNMQGEWRADRCLQTIYELSERCCSCLVRFCAEQVSF